MPREERLPPSAASLTASMRDLGYSLESAVADLIDNSISAEATRVDIYCEMNCEEPVLAVVDNGHGILEADILQAMRHGSANPIDRRKSDDLGRFGLGLKTASFSQCRKLTLVSSSNGGFSGAEWDLDLVDEKDDWIIAILDPQEIQAVPFANLIKAGGTAVVWRKLDRLSDEETGTKRDEIVNDKLSVLHKHLALVFHRYLAGEIPGRQSLTIRLNGSPVRAFDPFCRNNPATQVLPLEIVKISGERVKMQPYILPHHSKLSASEYEFYQGRSDFLSNQGAYVYRNGRLMAWGDWFRLVPKGEATKLARVQIDFPSTLDRQWTIDIKKSRAAPPYQVRTRLRQLIQEIAGRSQKIHKGRGQRLYERVSSPLWLRYASSGGIRYALNSEHPLVGAIRGQLDESGEKAFDSLIDAVAASLPVEMIYSDFSNTPKEMTQQQPQQKDLITRLCLLKEILFRDSAFDANVFRDTMRSSGLFAGHEDIIEEFIEGKYS